MGNQFCPAATKDLIHELGEIEKGDKGYQAIFKGCLQIDESNKHEMIITEKGYNVVSFNKPISSNLEHLKSEQLQKQPNEIEQRGIIQFQEGGRYIGELFDGIPHGKGQEYNSNGDYYCGMFQNGVKQGLGRYEFANKQVYQGQFKQNMMWGHGIYYFSNKDIYEGDFFKNQRCGRGKYLYSKNSSKVLYFQGFYQGDLKDGKGSVQYFDHTMKGQWKNGLYIFHLDNKMLS